MNVNNVDVGYGKRLFVSSGGTAAIKFNPWRGTVTSSSGASVQYLSRDKNVYFGGSSQSIISSADSMTSLQISSGLSAMIYSGGVINSAEILSAGKAFVYDGGTVEDMQISSGGTALISGGTVNNAIVSSGGKHTGTLMLTSGAIVSAFDGSIIDFSVGDRTSADGYIINDLSLITGTPTYTITVSGDQTAGSYKLASGAANFAGSVSIGNGTTNYGTLTVNGSALEHNDKSYALISDNGNLSLTITENIKYPNLAVTSITTDKSSYTSNDEVTLIITVINQGSAEVSNFNLSIVDESGYFIDLNPGALAAGASTTVTYNLGKLSSGEHSFEAVADRIENIAESNEDNNSDFVGIFVEEYVPFEFEDGYFTGNFAGGSQDMLMAAQDGKVSIYANNDVWSELTLDDGWNVVGAGDFNGDGKADILRKHTSGLVIGEMSDGQGDFTPQVLNSVGSGWGIKGTGDFNGDGVGDVLIANPTAASDGNPDYPKDQPPIGLLGYWKGGTEWTLINGYSPEWKLVATGDYNNDGKTDMLWRNEFVGAGDLTYNAYCAWIVDNANDWRMVSVANPDDWDYLCIGDFNADGCNDIAMINGDGVVGIWGVNDGYMNSWSILSAVTSDWKLAGVGDFNGDGTDDIAWCNSETGLTGYWQIKDKILESWQNIATIS